MKLQKKRIKWIVLLIFLAVLFSPYLKVEYLTWRHGDEFTDGYQQTNMIEEVEYLKVMGYSDTNAKVYYVLGDHAAAVLITFVKQGNQWVMDIWEAIWSRSGSADGFIWPYYR